MREKNEIKSWIIAFNAYNTATIKFLIGATTVYKKNILPRRGRTRSNGRWWRGSVAGEEDDEGGEWENIDKFKYYYALNYITRYLLAHGDTLVVPIRGLTHFLPPDQLTRDNDDKRVSETSFTRIHKYNI